MNASRLGVGMEPGVGGRDAPVGRRLKRRREIWDWMSPKEADGVDGWRWSMGVNESHSAGDSAVKGEKDGL
jgi:hypothetical protein